jgi:hypothetical protein
MDREELPGKLRLLADCDTRPVRPLGDVMEAAADLLDQQAARIAELEAERDEYVFGKSFAERWHEDLARVEAERDEARARFNDKDLCLNGQAPCEDLLAAERTAYSAGWIAGRDAAAAWCDRFRHPDQGGGLAGSLADAIRALTPPEDRP